MDIHVKEIWSQQHVSSKTSQFGLCSRSLEWWGRGRKWLCRRNCAFCGQALRSEFILKSASSI